MKPVILLDAGPLGLLSNPNRKGQTVACRKWLQALVAAARRVIVPEIADYEVRRELLRANKAKGVARLDALAGLLEYLPLTTAAMRGAAELWAHARQQGQSFQGRARRASEGCQFPRFRKRMLASFPTSAWPEFRGLSPGHALPAYGSDRWSVRGLSGGLPGRKGGRLLRRRLLMALQPLPRRLDTDPLQHVLPADEVENPLHTDQLQKPPLGDEVQDALLADEIQKAGAIQPDLFEGAVTHR